MRQADVNYYRERIAAERNAAKRATHPAAAESHRRLAEEYANLVEQNEGVSRNGEG